jgi:hypothetical protein
MPPPVSIRHAHRDAHLVERHLIFPQLFMAHNVSPNSVNEPIEGNIDLISTKPSPTLDW